MGIFGLIMLALGILSWLIFDQRLQAFGPVKNKIKTNKKNQQLEPKSFNLYIERVF